MENYPDDVTPAMLNRLDGEDELVFGEEEIGAVSDEIFTALPEWAQIHESTALNSAIWDMAIAELTRRHVNMPR